MINLFLNDQKIDKNIINIYKDKLTVLMNQLVKQQQIIKKISERNKIKIIIDDTLIDKELDLQKNENFIIDQKSLIKTQGPSQ